MSQVTESWIRALQGAKSARDAGATLPALLPALAAAHGGRTALLGEDQVLSYAQLAQRASAVGAWTAAAGVPAGCSVCLLMPNCPDYVAIWLGLSGAGRVVALLNTALRGDALLHCIAAAGSNAVIVDRSLLAAVEAVADRLPQGAKVWVAGGEDGRWPAFRPAAGRMPAGTPAPSDRALLVYTSGTTGLPKATVITHARVVEWSYWFAGLTHAGPEDRLYDCLPLYHSTGGIVAVGAMLVAGGSVLIRERFSASRFWDDLADGGCTIFQYIGELCRYLVNSPPHLRERGHRLRLACGNGLGGDIWQRVQDRFAIPHILEFYAATEGGVSLYNLEGKPGSIGRVPPFLQHRLGVALVQHDVATGQPARDASGRCIPCGADEPGEAIGRLDEGRRFDGYTDPGASAAKVLADVFAPGDRWFRTGDLLRRDAAGFFYFVDRIGDSFRWKGENVSAAEVAGVLRSAPGVADAAVYGVRIPGQDGRAGMAALTVADGFALDRLHAHLQAALPTYAQPLFVRLCPALDVTGTFKLAKGRLAAEGYAGTDDPVWLNEHGAGRFVRMNPALIAAIGGGERRL